MAPPPPLNLNKIAQAVKRTLGEVWWDYAGWVVMVTVRITEGQPFQQFKGRCQKGDLKVQLVKVVQGTPAQLALYHYSPATSMQMCWLYLAMLFCRPPGNFPARQIIFSPFILQGKLPANGPLLILLYQESSVLWNNKYSWIKLLPKTRIHSGYECSYLLNELFPKDWNPFNQLEQLSCPWPNMTITNNACCTTLLTNITNTLGFLFEQFQFLLGISSGVKILQHILIISQNICI